MAADAVQQRGEEPAREPVVVVEAGPVAHGHAGGRQAEGTHRCRTTVSPAAVVPEPAPLAAQLLHQQLGGLVVALGEHLADDGAEPG